MPVENKISTSAVSRFARKPEISLDVGSFLAERSKDLTVDRATMRGKLIPTFTSLRSPAKGFGKRPPCLSRAANIDFKVANLRRTVRGFDAAILDNHP
jgi:hypothetical protein